MKILLGMSGGIDSTVSAMLLQEQGYEVVGVTFRTFDSIKESCLAREKGCCSIDSIMEAKHNAQRMGIDHHIVDFRDTFREHVIGNFIDEYMHGRTPNPCVLCNSHIKWGEMLRVADELGCPYVATGHYARICTHRDHYYLAAAADTRKDQTYFLWMLTEDNLRRTIFPLGDLTKQQVRDIAREHGYPALAEKKESQEICFVTDNDYRTFLRENVTDYDRIIREGNYVDAEGEVLGRHCGYPNYTIGQRKGLGIALGHPAHVIAIRPETNEVVLGTNDDLYQTQLTASQVRIRDPKWLAEDPTVLARIRYKSAPVEATVALNSSPESGLLDSPSKVEGVPPLEAGEYETHPCAPSNSPATLHFREPVWGITPGQSVVLYKDNLVIGGGIIS